LALERLHWCDERHERLVYDLPKVQPDGHTTLPLTPLALICSRCGGPVRIVAFVIEAAPIRQILEHVGEPLEPPVLRPARGPPDEFFADQTICLDEQVNQDRYEFEPDQRLSG
jgi:hypothetical protein